MATSSTAISGLEYGADPLEWDAPLTSEDRRDIARYADTNLKYILPRILFADGVEEAKMHAYPDRQAVVARCAAVAVERTTTLMIPAHVENLRIRYAQAPEKILGVPAIAHAKDASMYSAKRRIRRTESELHGYLKQIVDDTIDYKEWGDNPKLAAARYNVLHYMAQIGVSIPRLASLSDLKKTAVHRLEKSLTVTELEKKLIVALYHLDDTRNITSFSDLTEIADKSTGETRRRITYAMVRLTERPEVATAKGQSHEATLPVLPQSPDAGLQMLRNAWKSKELSLVGGNDGLPVAYLEILQERLRNREGGQKAAEILGDHYQTVIRRGYTLILRYCKRSGSPIASQIERDSDLLDLFLREAASIYRAGKSRVRDRVSQVVISIGAEEFRQLQDRYPDIPDWCLDYIIINNLGNIEEAVSNFRSAVAQATMAFSNDCYLSKYLIERHCVFNPKNYMELLSRYVDNAQVAEAHFSSTMAVTAKVIRYYAEGDGSIIERIESWLSRRQALIDYFPLNMDVTPTFLGNIAMRRPTPDQAKRDGYEDDLADRVMLVKSYTNNLRVVRTKYRYTADVGDAVIRKSAKLNPGNAERGVMRYLAHLDTLRETFSDDQVVGDRTLQYYAAQAILVSSQAAENAVREWKQRYLLLSKQYGDNPEIDDEMIQMVAARWGNRPATGFELYMKRRRRRFDSMQREINKEDSSGYTVGDTIADYKYSPDRIIEQTAERESFQATIFRQLTLLEEAEQQAVLIVYGLEDMLDEEVDIQKLHKILGTNDLVRYVEEVIMPKLRPAND